jgi:succinyl-CoA synthetase beta subunit
MNLHEYQAKEIFQKFEVPVQRGEAVDSPEDAVKVAKKLKEETGTEAWIVKAQIHAGGRGKGGGIKLAKSIDEVKDKADEILGMKLVTPQTDEDGKEVKKVLIAQDAFYEGEREPSEIYLSILTDREKGKNVIMYSTEGGMEIEEVAEKTPHLIFKEWVDPGVRLQPYQARKVGFNLGLEGDAFKQMLTYLPNLYRAFEECDASLIEINPLLRTSDNKLLTVDSKMRLEDSALFRHPDLKEMRDISEEEPTEVEASKYGLSFIKLDGNVGCMVNGAGLAMAIMDVIKSLGGVSEMSRKTGLSREALYRAFSEDGNPRLSSLVAILHALGLDLSIVPRRGRSAA